ncbi:MAG TPA: DinB family protein [Alphaproteobacteria bacterium]
MNDKTIAMINYTRQQMLSTLDGLTPEQINKTPQGFNNNLIWNLAHCVGVLQKYIYRKGAELPVGIDEAIITEYDGGTFPKNFVNQDEIDNIKKLAFSTLETLSKDIANGNFKNFNIPEVTANKISLETIDDGLAFMLYHEGTHLGTMKAIRTAVAA